MSTNLQPTAQVLATAMPNDETCFPNLGIDGSGLLLGVFLGILFAIAPRLSLTVLFVCFLMYMELAVAI